MKVKQMRRLEQIPFEDRLELIQEGLVLIAKNVDTLLSESEKVWQSAPRAFLLLRSLAEEESGKAFILVDYVRPPRGVTRVQLSAHLSQVYSHLARGIYAEYYETHPATFGEVVEFVERQRVSYYLDGMEGFEWIFRNRIMQRREEAMYVDLVDVERELRWEAPDFTVKQFMTPTPRITGLLISMVCSGLLSARGLSVLRDIWASEELTTETSWQRCVAANRRFLDQMCEAGVDVPKNLANHVKNHFSFPLSQVDLSEKKIDYKELENHRDEAICMWEP